MYLVIHLFIDYYFLDFLFIYFINFFFYFVLSQHSLACLTAWRVAVNKDLDKICYTSAIVSYEEEYQVCTCVYIHITVLHMKFLSTTINSDSL